MPDTIKDEIIKQSKTYQDAFNKFDYNKEFKGKLIPKRVKGGIVLVQENFTIRFQEAIMRLYKIKHHRIFKYYQKMFKYECKQNHNYYPLDYALKIDRLNEKIFETFWQKQLHNLI